MKMKKKVMSKDFVHDWFMLYLLAEINRTVFSISASRD